VLPHLDGEHDRAAIVAALAQRVADGRLVIHEQGVPVIDATRISQVLADALEPCLERLARLALLEA
jgi:methyltransferase-like protein